MTDSIDERSPCADYAQPRHPAVGIIDTIVENARAIEQAVRPGDGEYHLRELVAVYEWAVNQQVYVAGDRVELACDLDLSNAPGWRPWARLLVKGSVCTVKDVAFAGAGGWWGAHVIFDADDSDRPGTFFLSLSKLVPHSDGYPATG